MPTQSLTVQIPDGLYSRLRERATQANRTIEAELVDVLAEAIPVENGLPADLEAELSRLVHVEDLALWQVARERLPDDLATRLQDLHAKRQRDGLTEAEARDMADLVRQYERMMLIRARAVELLKERGHDISSLAIPR
jgi:plasmid stability protein